MNKTKKKLHVLMFLNTLPDRDIQWTNTPFPAPDLQGFRLATEISSKKKINITIIAKSYKTDRIGRGYHRNVAIRYIGVKNSKKIINPLKYLFFSLIWGIYICHREKSNLIYANEPGLPLYVGYMIKTITRRPLYLRDGSQRNMKGRNYIKPNYRSKSLRTHLFLSTSQRILKHADMIQAVSIINYQWFKNLGIPQEKLILIPNAIRIIKNFTLKKNKRKLKLLYIGSLNKRKDPETVVTALGLLKKDYDHWQLTILGDGELRNTIKAQISGLNLSDSIKLEGFVKYVSKFLRESDIFILPSLSEGLSNSLLEAMNFGLAVVVSNIPQNMFVIGKGRYGLFFNVGDPVALRDTLIELFKDSQQLNRYKKMARKRIETTFSLSKLSGIVLKEWIKTIQSSTS